MRGSAQEAVFPELAEGGTPKHVAGCADTQARAHRILRQAEREAQALLQAARDKIAALTAEAAREGRREGRSTALTETRGLCVAAVRALEAAALQLRHAQDEFRTAAGEAIVSLAMTVAEHVCRRAIAQEPGLILGTVQDALRLLPESGDIVVRLHPDQVALIEEHQRELVGTRDAPHGLRLVPDPEIEPGGCLVETPDCLVDASLPARLEEACRRLQGEPG
jgi:flagellar assembly protein FliH